ncbi:MAG: hypothetical protein KBA67_05970 [Leptotrichiaceae bacterium]|nr:hypothetical protein [Leptotrichiaceae bacterium]MBP9630413.1 hypothetical protein [Leptotrichiaceae bacterium]
MSDSNARPVKPIFIDMNNSIIGRGGNKENPANIEDLSKAKVILKINGTDREFDLLTAYPVK